MSEPLKTLVTLLQQPQPDFDYRHARSCALAVYRRFTGSHISSFDICSDDRARDIFFFGTGIVEDTRLSLSDKENCWINMRPHHVRLAIEKYLATGEIISPHLFQEIGK